MAGYSELEFFEKNIESELSLIFEEKLNSYIEELLLNNKVESDVNITNLIKKIVLFEDWFFKKESDFQDIRVCEITHYIDSLYEDDHVYNDYFHRVLYMNKDFENLDLELHY